MYYMYQKAMDFYSPKIKVFKILAFLMIIVYTCPGYKTYSLKGV